MATSEYLIIGADTKGGDHLGNLDELTRLTTDIVDGWYQGEQIDWEDVWDRLDGAELADGRVLDIVAVDSPIQRLIVRRVHKRD